MGGVGSGYGKEVVTRWGVWQLSDCACSDWVCCLFYASSFFVQLLGREFSTVCTIHEIRCVDLRIISTAGTEALVL
jgi:hypothetical protein